MNDLARLYRPSLTLFTDLYQLTMAYGYWKAGIRAREAVFHLTFRQPPFRGGYTIACGLQQAVDYLNNFHFDKDDLNYLSSLGGNDGKPLFEDGFLNYLYTLRFTCDVDAVPEGTVIFPHEPLVRVRGPIVQCQLIESALLNIINFQTLIATKAARVTLAARGEPVLELGLRRAQGIDGSLSASRAAYIGGCAATSNVLAGRLYGIPVKGTHSHAWVMCFENDAEAFSQYADAMPNNCVFLVDTFDTLAGVESAIAVGRRLREEGFEMVGIRLDSGDLAWLSREARQRLDDAGFPNAAIIASNDLDEHLIENLKHQGAKINIWGVGTRLITGGDQAALGGVYKLAAIRDPGGLWQYKIKRSEQAEKTSTPSIQQVRRFHNGSEYIGDMIFDTENPPGGICKMIDSQNSTRQKKFARETSHHDLLVPIITKGELTARLPDLDGIRNRVRKELSLFHSGVKRLVHPHQYPVGIEAGLYQRRRELLRTAPSIRR